MPKPTHLASWLPSSASSALDPASSRSASSRRCAVPPRAEGSVRTRMRLAASSVRASWAASLVGREEGGEGRGQQTFMQRTGLKVLVLEAGAFPVESGLAACQLPRSLPELVLCRPLALLGVGSLLAHCEQRCLRMAPCLRSGFSKNFVSL